MIGEFQITSFASSLAICLGVYASMIFISYANTVILRSLNRACNYKISGYVNILSHWNYKIKETIAKGLHINLVFEGDAKTEEKKEENKEGDAKTEEEKKKDEKDEKENGKDEKAEPTQEPKVEEVVTEEKPKSLEIRKYKIDDSSDFLESKFGVKSFILNIANYLVIMVLLGIVSFNLMQDLLARVDYPIYNTNLQVVVKNIGVMLLNCSLDDRLKLGWVFFITLIIVPSIHVNLDELIKGVPMLVVTSFIFSFTVGSLNIEGLGTLILVVYYLPFSIYGLFIGISLLLGGLINVDDKSSTLLERLVREFTDDVRRK